MLCTDLQPYSHYFFSKILRTLFDFLNNTYWVFFFLEKQLANISEGVSCFSVTIFYFTLFCCGGKVNLVLLTLFYSTLLTLTDGQNYRQRKEYTRFAWAGGTFFSVRLLFQVFVLAGNRFWFYILLCT